MRPSMNRRFIAGRIGTSWRIVRPGRAGDQSSTGEQGFTLAEVIVSIALFTIISFSVMLALITLVKYTGVTQNRVAAANLARQEVEKLRGENSTLSQLDLTASTVTLKGVSYTVTPRLSPAGNVTCAAGASRNATVTVTWNDSGTRSVRYDTVLSC
jgi:prepilin-type N-terminal cleavage/methylation domain-containing protein